MSTFDVTTLVARTAVSFTVPYDALGIVLGVFVVVLGCALSALFTRLWFSKYQSEFAKDDAAIVTQLTGVNVLGLSLVVPAIPTALVDTATSIGDTIPRLDTLAISFAIYMVCMVVIAYHPTLAETAVRIQQCNVQPVLTGLVFHLANFVRLLYNALWPIVSLGYGYFVLISRGHIKVLRACAIGTFDIHAIFNHLADIGQAVVDSLIAYLGGDIFHDPIPLTNVFAQIGHTSNALVPALMCYCAWFEPLIVLVTSIPQITALHVTADAVVNAALRLLQLLLNALITWSPPVWDEFANELITAVTAVGSLLRDALILVIDYLTDLLHQIELLSASRPAAIEALFGLDDAMPPPPPQMAASTTKAMPPSGKEEVLEEETDDNNNNNNNNNNNTTFSSQQARAPAFTSADLFHVVANTPRSRSRWAVGSGKHRVELGTAATAGPRARLSAMRDDYDVVVNAPIWELPPGMDLADLLGLPVLITVLETPWPRAVTELAAAAIVLGNMTLNMICNPVALVQGPSAIAYFQFGPVFDHIRASGDAASQLLVFVDPNLPAVVSLLAQAAVTLAEAVMELFVGTLNAIVYPTWSFGEPPPTDCSAPGACTYPAPIGWTILFIYPDYYDWSNSALRRALRTLEYMADATLVMLGRDSTDTHQEHCAKKPVACTFYDTLLVATEAVNLTLTFLFYFPELVLFDDDRRTFQNIDLSRIHDRFYDLVEHISAWVALLDDEEIPCMSTTPPDGFENPRDDLPPPDPDADLRLNYDCGYDSLVYELDGALRIEQTFDTWQDSVVFCDLHANTSGCAMQFTADDDAQFVQFLGNPRQDESLLALVRADLNAENWAPIVFDMAPPSNGSRPYDVEWTGNMTEWSADYGIVARDWDDCRAPAPLPDPLPLGWGCYMNDTTSENGIAVYRPLDSYDVAYLGAVYHYTPGNDSIIDDDELEPVTCRAVSVKDYSCTDGPAYKGQRLGIMDATNVFRRIETLNSLVGVANCGGDPTRLPLHTVCRYNRLYYMDALGIDDSPVITAVTGDYVPCLLQYPDDYACSVNETGPALASNGTAQTELIYFFNNSAIENTTVPCMVNPTYTPPECTHVHLEYDTGRTIDLLLEGVELRVYVDGDRVPMRCASPALAPTSTSTPSPPPPPPPPPSGETDSSNGTETTQPLVVHIEQYYGVRVDADSPRLSFEQRVAIARARARESLRTPMSMIAPFVNAQNVTLYPKDSFVCSLMRTLNPIGRFFVAYFFELIYTARSLLILPAGIPGYIFEVPTFRDALEELRSAMCELMGTITNIIPATYHCDRLTPNVGCKTGAMCARGMLCHAADIALLILEIPVEILETIRDLTDGDGHVPSTSPVLGDDCAPNKAGNCIASIIVYVIVKVTFSVTKFLRSVAINVDCLLCALGNAIGIKTCQAIVYMIVEPLTKLAEGLVGIVLATIVKLAVSLISLIVYLLSGDWKRFASEIGRFFKLFGQMIGDFAKLVLEVVLHLPIIGDIVNFFTKVISGACKFLQDAINFFAKKKVNLRCPSARSRKRACQVVDGAGWLEPDDDVLAAMTPACRAAVAEFNATDVLTTEEQQHELAVCLASRYWLNDVPAAAAVDGYENECDARVPAILRANVRWAEFNDEERYMARSCTATRFRVMHLQESTPFVPRDILDNPFVRVPDLLEQLFFAFSVYRQYSRDRHYPAAVVLSSEYAANTQYDGFSTAHLDLLRSAAHEQDGSLALVQAALDAPDDEAPEYLTIQAYALRAVDQDEVTSFLPWPEPRVRDPDQIAHMVRFYDQWLGDGRSAPPPPAVAAKKRAHDDDDDDDDDDEQLPTVGLGAAVARVMDHVLTRLARRHVLPPPRINITDMMSSASQTPYGAYLGEAVFFDIPTIVSRALIEVRDQNLVARTFTGGLSLAETVYVGAVAGLYATRDVILGHHTAQSRALPVRVKGVNMSAYLPPPARTIWRTTFENGKSVVTAAIQKMMHMIDTTISGAITFATARPPTMSAFNLFMQLSSASPRSVLRRVRLRALAAVVQGLLLNTYVDLTKDRSNSTKRNYDIVRSIDYVEDDELRAVLNSASSAPPPGIYATALTCSTNFTALCHGCYYLDHMIGGLENGIEVVATYYQGPESQEPSFAFGRAAFDRDRAYFTSPAPRVIVGDSPTNPVRWPWNDRSWLRILGDPTPNKLRFSDLRDFFMDTLALFFGDDSTTGGTSLDDDVVGLPLGSVSVARLKTSDPIGSLGVGLADSILTYLVDSGNSTAAAAAVRHTPPPPPPPPNTSVAAAVPLSEIPSLAKRWVDYFWSWFRTCRYREELDGSQKRFSLAEAFAMTGSLTLVWLLVAQRLALASLVVYPLAGAIVGPGTLIIAYSWGLSCGLALPQQLADDLMYALVYQVGSLGPWLLGGIIKNSTFVNEEAAICENYDPPAEGGYEYAHCVDEVGMDDLGYVIAFILQAATPSVVQAINSTHLILVRQLVHTDWVQARINAFAHFNASDDREYSIHWSCALVYLSWTHLGVAQFYLQLFSVLVPLVKLLAMLILSLIAIATMCLMLIHALLNFLVLAPIRVAAARHRAIKLRQQREEFATHYGVLGHAMPAHLRAANVEEAIRDMQYADDAMATPLPRRAVFALRARLRARGFAYV